MRHENQGQVAIDDARGRVAFRRDDGVGTPKDRFTAPWLAYAYPCRRFAPGLAADDARRGADAVCSSFIVVDFHHLLLAGIPAHCPWNSRRRWLPYPLPPSKNGHLAWRPMSEVLMSHVVYAKPPIIEAVIDVQFTEPLDKNGLGRLKERFSKKYAGAEDQIEIQIKPGLAGVQVTHGQQGFKFSSEAHDEAVILRPKALATCRMAPYPGWDSFYDAAFQNWRLYRSVIDYRRVGRIAVRYINRIDIPQAGEIIDTDAYLLIGPRHPLSRVYNYAVQIAGTGEDNCKIIINTGLTESPVINHLSVMLDIDLSRDADVPQKDVDIWAFIATLRDQKNRVFESCVTDRSRAIFSK